LLGDFNGKVGRENIFKPTTGNEILNEISNINGVRVVKFATSKICQMYWTSPDIETYNQIGHNLIHRRRYSSVLDVQSFRAADFGTEHYLVVVNVRKRLAVNKNNA
jgi:hypothetical protein